MTPPRRNGNGDDDYRVGYRKPPKDTRFQPGRSGNPKGRPKGSKNLKTILDRVLNEPIDVRQNGQPKQISTIEAVLKSLALCAMKGDAKAASLLIATKRGFDAVESEKEAPLLDEISVEALDKRLSTLIERERKAAPDEGSDAE